MLPIADLLFLILFDATKQVRSELDVDDLPDHPDKLDERQRKQMRHLCEILVQKHGLFTHPCTGDCGLQKAYDAVREKYAKINKQS